MTTWSVSIGGSAFVFVAVTGLPAMPDCVVALPATPSALTTVSRAGGSGLFPSSVPVP